MSRKPIDKQQPSECRQAIWDWVRTKGDWSFASTEVDVKLDRTTIREYLSSLCKAGYLELVSGSKRGEANVYRLINDTGVDAPRLRKDGTPVTQGQGQQYMWNAMRILKTFSAYDLAFNASTDAITISAQTALSYIKALCKAGYLVPKKDNQYMLIPQMWTGPHPPQIQKTKQVYDPNLHRVVWSKVEGGAE